MTPSLLLHSSSTVFFFTLFRPSRLPLSCFSPPLRLFLRPGLGEAPAGQLRDTCRGWGWGWGGHRAEPVSAAPVHGPVFAFSCHGFRPVRGPSSDPETGPPQSVTPTGRGDDRAGRGGREARAGRSGEGTGPLSRSPVQAQVSPRGMEPVRVSRRWILQNPHGCHQHPHRGSGFR